MRINKWISESEFLDGVFSTLKAAAGKQARKFPMDLEGPTPPVTTGQMANKQFHYIYQIMKRQQ